MLINEATCSLCIKSKSFVCRTSAEIAQPQLSFYPHDSLIYSYKTVRYTPESTKCVSVNLKKIDRPLQLKDSIIQQRKVYSSDKTTTKIPGNHQSL